MSDNGQYWSLNKKTIMPLLKIHKKVEEYEKRRKVQREFQLKQFPNKPQSNKISAFTNIKILEEMGFVVRNNALWKKGEEPEEIKKEKAKRRRMPSIKPIEPPKEVREGKTSKNLIQWLFATLENPLYEDDELVVSEVGYEGLALRKGLQGNPMLFKDVFAKYIEKLTNQEDEAKKFLDSGKVLTKIDQLMVAYAEKSESNNGKLERCLKLLTRLLTTVDAEQAKEINAMIEDK